MGKFDGATELSSGLAQSASVVEMALELGIDVSMENGQRPTETARQRLRQRWLQRNATAIEEYNERVRKEAMFSEPWRTFMRDEGRSSGRWPATAHIEIRSNPSGR